MKVRDRFLNLTLNRIEECEAKLLVWGIVDGFFSYHEVCDLINPLLDEAINDGLEDYFSAEDVLEELLRRQLITKVPRKGGDIGYRSRMAETVRLIQRVRQLFPKHAGPTGWQSAPSLVADYRFLRRRRRYPYRNIATQDVLSVISQETSSPALLAAVKYILSSSAGTTLLSGFQVRSTQRILRAIETGKELATIICAGTGSGKTLAFYLPALTSIYRHRQADKKLERWVKTISLYPRTELLKDQLREVLQRIRNLQKSLQESDQVSISVGALFSDTPSSARYCSWPTAGNDLICPILSCLDCGAEMRWLHEDRNKGRERLVCSSCQATLDGNIFPLTRDTLKKSPPDILLTTTEMLNQRLSDNSMMHLFGVGTKALRAPELVLMDEVHTYEGKHGAQVAYLMRRWQSLLEQRLRFVGLSATLREASQFFATLTGCSPKFVDEVSPTPSEIEHEGAEYMIAIRGDPVSQTALLSTTIQTAMLLQRCLDPKAIRVENSISHGAFGQRTFVFTDNLDVINRLYFDLLSAEGRNSYGEPDMRNAPDGGLAVLRDSGSSLSRYENGQDWRFCQQLHHSLKQRLVVKRVSSQDRGVDSSADIIVATAALEVGFDDPTVGGVIQHKAPRSMAGFLQRKGRGGRTRGMRPWTAVVLSDYGRDRIAYQSYDLLFDPELSVRTLPLSNRYITRIQAVYATLDYLTLRLQDGPEGSVWSDMTGERLTDQRRKLLLKELRNILASDAGIRRLSQYLSRALRLSPEELSAILWEYPRPLLTTVLPTALRRLNSDWSAFGKRQQDYKAFNNPLPDFIPGSLFADLNLAEVAIELPGTSSNSSFDIPAMSVFSALREFAPGRVSRRYGVHYRTERHWIPPSLDFQSGDSITSGNFYLDIESIGSHISLGEYLIRQNGQTTPLQVYQPIRLTPQAPAKAVKDSSNGNLEWHSQIIATAEPNWLRPPVGGLWSEIITNIGFFTHSNHAPVDIRRFAVGGSAEIGVGAEKVKTTTIFQLKDQAVGLGAHFAADGMVFQIQIPFNLHSRQQPGTEAKWRALRSARFINQAWRAERLTMIPNPFMREWLAHIYLSALTYEAMCHKIELVDAAASIQEGKASISLLEVLGLLFQSDIIEVQGDDNAESSPDKLRKELDSYLRDPIVTAELHELGATLWSPIDATWEPWLRGVYLSTLAAALSRSIIDLCPNIDADDMAVDLDRGPTTTEQSMDLDLESSEIWFTERSPGGNGLIEEFMGSYAKDPRRFFATVRANLGMGEFELIEHQINKLVTILADENLSSNSESVEQVRQFREASSQEDRTGAFQTLRKTLLQDGFLPFHGFLVALGNRVLRPGSGLASDHYLAGVLEHWQSEEERLGIEVDMRVISYYLSLSDEIDSIVSEIAYQPSGNDRTAWRMGAIYGLLWPRGRAIRQSALQIYNPFSELPLVERLLVIDTISDDRVNISLLDEDWFIQATKQLSNGLQVTLTCNESKRPLLSKALNFLTTNPIESGYLRAYARLQGIRLAQSMIEADIELVEAAQ